MNIDVLCVGHACYDLVFSVNHHPLDDEKIVAENFFECGGGPAANAAVTVAKLGFTTAFAGYLGHDIYGEKHYQELLDWSVNTDLIIRGSSPTPLSTILVKPNGNRALVNYKGDTQALRSNAIDFSSVTAKVILFDGHEPHLSLELVHNLKQSGSFTVLDAGSMHEGTLSLMTEVDYLVCSEKFAVQFAGDEITALERLGQLSNNVVITLGERGLLWQKGEDRGNFPAFPVTAIDTTGAGDAFHGAFAAAIASGMDWENTLRFASAAGAICCTKIGARLGLPSLEEHKILFNYHKKAPN